MGGGHLNAGGTVDLLLAIVEQPGRIAGGETEREQGLCVRNGRACGIGGRAVCIMAWCNACPSLASEHNQKVFMHLSFP